MIMPNFYIVMNPIALFSHIIASDNSSWKSSKVSFLTLSDQLLMENLVSEVENKKMFYRKRGVRRYVSKSNDIYFPCCEWYGVKCTIEDAVERLEWNCSTSFDFEGGTLNVTWMPQRITVAIISHHELKGSIDSSRLPKDLSFFDLSFNRFSGTIDLTTLPEGMKALYLSGNKITGPIDITSLPPRLEVLLLNGNNINQEIVIVDALPTETQYIHLGGNTIGMLKDAQGEQITTTKVYT